MLMITSGMGKHRIQLEQFYIGDHLLLVVKGGEQPHIGSVIICEPNKKTEIVRLGTHKDYIVLRPLAETACEKYHTTVVAVGGIHINQATSEDIERVIQNCKEIQSCI